MRAQGLLGTSVPQLALGISNGLILYAAQGITAITVDVGTLGTGVGTGIGVIVPPLLISKHMLDTFAAALILGPFSPPLINAISLGLSQSLLTANINTQNTGVGLGVGTLFLIPSSGAPFFIDGFTKAGIAGPSAQSMATAVATALDIALAIPTPKGVVAIAGPPNILPGAGAGQGKIS